MSYKTIWEANGIYWQYFGIVTFNDILISNTEFYENQKSDTAKYQIAHFYHIDRLLVEPKDIARLAAHDFGAEQSFSNNLKIALVTENQQVIEIFRAYINYMKELNSSWAFNLFDNLDSARKWVSLPPLEM